MDSGRNFKILVSALGDQGSARMNIHVLILFNFGHLIQKLSGSDSLLNVKSVLKLLTHLKKKKISFF